MNDGPERSKLGWGNPALSALIDPALEPVLLPPDRVGVPSRWWGHVPFAHWLVHELEPRLVVELGTSDGISFSAFCNVVRNDGLPTRCYAIGTGAGHGEDAFGSLDETVQRRYAAFASLVRSPVDAARELFADASIDLLHIDGTHGDDVARTLYEAWRPKLSRRATVLLHGTAIVDPGLGVWRFWQELARQHPAFEWSHGCGLGVLAPGRDVPPFVAALVGLEPAAAATLRQRLAEWGERWVLAATVDALDRATLAAQADRLRLQQAMQLQERATAAARDKVAVLSKLAAAQRVRLAEAELGQSALREQLADVVEEAAVLRAQIEQVRTSMSWRVTGPYRVAGRVLKRRVLAPLRRSQQARDFRQIARSGAFDASFYRGRDVPPEEEAGAILAYLAASQNGRPWARQHPGLPPRRPVLGFHQLSYAAHCTAFDEAAGEDPVAHYLRIGQPDGRWKHRVITAHRPGPPATGLRILLHAHFHYPDLLDDLLDRLAVNASPVDLFLTTTSTAKADKLRQTLANRNRLATIVTVDNRGRDIGAMLMRFADWAGHDVVGHLHGKKSPQQAPTRGSNWRGFLWDHLVGGDYPMVDVMAEAFAADQRLGLVFPEDPNLNHWDMNGDLADAMAERLRLPLPLPPHFEFPKGTMFWARPAALRPLVDLGWRWDDFPPEPIRPDGTVLHTLERMIPLAAEHAGFTYATVHVPHSWRLPER